MKKTTRKSAPSKGASAKKLKNSKMYDIPSYAQTYEFTSSAACAMMVLKYLNKNFKLKKEAEFEIWKDVINGSVMDGSRYGVAFALAKRGASPQITSNVKDEGYEKKLAVYEGINLETLSASFNEIKEKTKKLNVKEQHGVVTLNVIKKHLNSSHIPIVLVNVSALNSGVDPAPHWVVVKGYDKDTVYINDPWQDSTVAMDPETFKTTIGFDGEHHMITVSSRSFNPRRRA